MVGNNPRNYYIAAVFFVLFSIFLGYKTWENYTAEKGSTAALFLVTVFLCLIEAALLVRNGRRRAKGISPRGSRGLRKN